MCEDSKIILYHKTESPTGRVCNRSDCVRLFSSGWVTSPVYFDVPDEDPKKIQPKVEEILKRPRKTHDILPLEVATKEFLGLEEV